jgi:hypothetical protein
MAGNTVDLSNNCVQDNATGLMWLKSYSPPGIGVNTGKGCYGTMPWTTDGDGNGVFEYLAAVNSASVGGHNDWRLPNANELISVLDWVGDFGIQIEWSDAFIAAWTSTAAPYYGAGNWWVVGYQLTYSPGIQLNYVVLVRGDPTAPTGGGTVSANVVQINGVSLTGNGASTPWGPGGTATATTDVNVVQINGGSITGNGSTTPWGPA